jgi:hypothetical protein
MNERIDREEREALEGLIDVEVAGHLGSLPGHRPADSP